MALAGCDSGLESVEGTLLVSVLPAVPGVSVRPQLALQTEANVGCSARLSTESESSAGRLGVTVRGLTADAVPNCPDGYAGPAYAFVPLPVPDPTVEIDVRHRGAADRYRYACEAAGCSLSAVSTSTTRLAPP